MNAYKYYYTTLFTKVKEALVARDIEVVTVPDVGSKNGACMYVNWDRLNLSFAIWQHTSTAVGFRVNGEDLFITCTNVEQVITLMQMFLRVKEEENESSC